MASQNLLGFATLRTAEHEPPVAEALITTTTICLGDAVHPERSQRWKVGLVHAAMWVVLGLAGPLVLTIL